MYGVTLVLGSGAEPLGRTRARGAEEEFRSGDVELSVPGDVRLTLAQAGVTSFFTIYWTREALGPAVDRENSPFYAVSLRSPGPLGESLARLHQSLVDGQDEVVVSALLEEAKRLLFEAPFQSAKRPPRPSKQKLGVERAVRLLRADLQTNIPLDVLAKEAGLSRYHFARCFQRFTGLAPRPYRRLLRAYAARRLLERGLSARWAAEKVGFAAAPHLSRTFRAFFGTSPQTWAKAWAASEPTR